MPPDPITRILNERIDRLEARFEDRIDERHADLRERIGELRQDIAMLTGTLLARLDAHEEYHRRNEHRWGLVRLAARHPFRLATAIAVFALMLPTAPGFRQSALQFLREISSLVF